MANPELSRPTPPDVDQRFQQLKANVSELIDPSDPVDDQTMMKFLIGQHFDVAKSSLVLRQCLLWRREKQIRTLLNIRECTVLTWENEILITKLYPHAWHGFSKQGNPIYYERTGHISRSSFYEKVSEEMLELHFTRVMQVGLLRAAAFSRIKAVEPSVARVIFVFDLDNLSLTEITPRALAYLKRVVTTQQNFFPETLRKMFIINSPVLFPPIWSLIKNFIDPIAASKISVIGSDFKEEMLEFIAEESLPSFIGGRCKDRACEPHGCIPLFRDSVNNGYFDSGQAIVQPLPPPDLSASNIAIIGSVPEVTGAPSSSSLSASASLPSPPSFSSFPAACSACSSALTPASPLVPPPSVPSPSPSPPSPSASRSALSSPPSSVSSSPTVSPAPAFISDTPAPLPLSYTDSGI